MSHLPVYHLQTLSPAGTGLHETEIPLSQASPEFSIRLRALPGASAIHLAVSGADGVCLRAEVPADENESVLVRLEQLEGQGPDGQPYLAATSPGRHVLTLAPDERYAAPLPIGIPSAGSPLDLALVIDGTTRAPSENGHGLLLSDAEAWASRVDQLTGFVDSLMPHFSDVRLAVSAFGDDPPSPAKAVDLQPRYRLHPAASQLSLEPFASESRQDLRQRLLALPPTSGGDFVDAVADALAACRQLRWRPEARKLLVLLGDSPGHSILHPPPLGAGVLVRELDVDREAMRLHVEEGVEIITAYLEPSSSGWREIDFKLQLVEFARAQYQRLASRPEMALTGSSLASSGAEIVLRQTGLLGRGSSWGEAFLEEVSRGEAS